MLIYNKEQISHLWEAMRILWQQKLYIIMEKCSFMYSSIAFLEFVIIIERNCSWSWKGKSYSCLASSHQHNIKPKLSWRSHLYWRFIKNFSTIMVPSTNSMKGGWFIWSNTTKAWKQLRKLIETPVLRLLDFSKLSKAEFDALKVGIGGVTYDEELYAVVQVLYYWRHYLIS